MEEIDSRLELAGRPAGLSVEEFVGLNTLLVGLVTALSIGISAAGKFPIWLSIILIFISVRFPMEIIKNGAKQGRDRMRKDVIDLGARLESGTTAGLPIIRMLEWASEGDSLLAKELRQMASEVRMGKPLYTVFSRIGIRYDIPEADELTLLIKHADQQGVEIARHLRSLNRDFRTRQEVEMNNEAAKIKPKVTMVLVLAAIVATWALVAGPPVQRALEQGFFNFGTF